jgi:transcription termination factor Rho
MAFSIKSLSRLSHAVPVGNAAGNATSVQVSKFLYASDDAAATVEAAAYFNNARAILNKGDIIIVSLVNSGTPVTKQYVVTAAPKVTGNVTVALQTTTAG